MSVTYKNIRIVPVIMVILMTFVAGINQGLTAPVTPRAVGLADNALPLSFGIDALTDNPAALAVGPARRWELRLFSLSSGLGSNALGLGDYRLYNGATLTESDKADILQKIPPDGWRLNAYADASAAALRFGSFGVRLSGFGLARGNIDREMLEILFYGNEVDRTYVSDFNSGEALAGAQLSLSYAAGLTSLKGHPVYGGLTVRVIRGLYYTELDEARGSLVAGLTGVDGSGSASATIAEGGTGIAFDWGALMTIAPRYTISVVLENAPGFITWSQEARCKKYSILFEGITADNFEDSLWVNEESTTPLNSFNRSFPARLRVGWGRSGEKLNTAVVASLGFSDRLAVSTTPELGAGGEYYLFSFLPLRAGLTIGGLHGFTAGLGGGLFLGIVHLELASRTTGGLWPTHGRGATLSFAGGLHF